jgi:hypothetical protein
LHNFCVKMTPRENVGNYISQIYWSKFYTYIFVLTNGMHNEIMQGYRDVRPRVLQGILEGILNAGIQ